MLVDALTEGVGQAMTDQTTEVFPLHFRDSRVGERKIDQTYRALWIAYQRGALSADAFLRSLEDEFLHSMEHLEARWIALKW
jgi:hypothetical protein